MAENRKIAKLVVKTEKETEKEKVHFTAVKHVRNRTNLICSAIFMPLAHYYTITQNVVNCCTRRFKFSVFIFLVWRSIILPQHA